MPATSIHPFIAAVYEDPANENDGAVDISSALLGGPYGTERLEKDHDGSLQASWITEGRLRLLQSPALFLLRSGWKDGLRAHQASFIIGVHETSASSRSQSSQGPPATAAAVANAPRVTTIDAPGFSELLQPEGIPLIKATTSTGVHHRLWAVRRAGVVTTIQDAVAHRPLHPTPPEGLIAVTESTSVPFDIPPGLLFWSNVALPAQ